MDIRPPSRTADNELTRRLDAEWSIVSRSRWMRNRLREWSADDPRLEFGDGDEQVAAAQRRDAASWAERDQVLSALLERAIDNGLARPVALQVVLPGLKSLVRGIRRWEADERAGAGSGDGAGCDLVVRG